MTSQSTSMSFDQAIKFTLKWEVGGKPDGGFTDDPRDPGKKTRWGISQRAHPDLDIKKLTKQQAIRIYETEYWRANKCDKLLSPANTAHFDACVNIGNWSYDKDGGKIYHWRANRMLQRVLNVNEDGIIGTMTLSAAYRHNPTALGVSLITERECYYARLLLSSPGKWRWAIRGWLNRCKDLLDLMLG